MYAKNLNFKFDFTNVKNLKFYTREPQKLLYVLQRGEQVSAKKMCDASDILFTQEKRCSTAEPGDSGYKSGDSGQDLRRIRPVSRSIWPF